MLPGLQARLRAELLAEGLDPDACAAVEDDSLLDVDAIPETGWVTAACQPPTQVKGLLGACACMWHFTCSSTSHSV